MAKWIVSQTDANLKLMSEVLNISEILSNVLANRDIRTKNTAIRYLYPQTRFLNDMRKMKDSEKAAKIILEAIKNQDKIVIYGDYDADGVTSTVILMKALQKLGADASYYIPHRESEGYGLNIGAVKTIKALETDLIITCDNGIAALEEILLLKKNNIKVVVIDHHEPDFVEKDERIDILPKADALVDPKQSACEYPFKMMCAAGIVYRFCGLLYEIIGKEFDKDNELLIFAMIGTFCDIVDLMEENRIIAKKGLDAINNQGIKNIGLAALLKEKNITNKKLNSFDIGFLIGPCINATGRLESAAAAVELFLTEDKDEAAEMAKKLNALNEERKRITNEAFKKSISLLNKNPELLTKVLVIFDDEVHESIAGIVAGRIKDVFFRPTIVLTNGESSIKGSARSIEAYNIFENLNKIKELFLRFGGHKMAAGLSIKKENIEILQKRLNDDCPLSDEDFVEIIDIDKELNFEDITLELAYEIERLEPFGKANKEPLFLTKGLSIAELRVLEEKNTILMTLCCNESYKKLRTVCFGKVEKFMADYASNFDDNIVEANKRNTDELKIDIVYNINVNEFNGNILVNLKIKDFRIQKK